MTIWAACVGERAVVPVTGNLVRVVESQEQVATNALVDDLDEQALLEQMLEASKPPNASASKLHYLLSTPFRYPPLRHGSRFGGRHEPSLFYAALDVSVALAEAAYYRLVFWFGMIEPPPGQKLTTEHTVFGVPYRSSKGIQLQHPPFDRFLSEITNPRDYSVTQQLGADMRASGVQVFEYPSARDVAPGLNVALFTPEAFADKSPTWQQAWLAETRAEQVSFYNKEAGFLRFGIEQFLRNGDLPTPAF